MDTTVCEGDNATFTCMVLIASGLPSNPQWGRNHTLVDRMHHTITSNLTGGEIAPITISSTLTVSSVTVVDDNGMSYACGIGVTLSSVATLTVVGKYSYHDLMFA